MSYYSDAVVTNAGDGVLQLYNGGAQLTIDGAVGGTGTVSTSALMIRKARGISAKWMSENSTRRSATKS